MSNGEIRGIRRWCSFIGIIVLKLEGKIINGGWFYPLNFVSLTNNSIKAVGDWKRL